MKVSEFVGNWTPCDYNIGVDCSTGGICVRCGWNPKVAQKRINALRVKQDSGTLVQKKEEEVEE